jgi:hypothetical protein
MDHIAAGGDKGEFRAHGDANLVRCKDLYASYQAYIIAPRSDFDRAGLVKWSGLSHFCGVDTVLMARDLYPRPKSRDYKCRQHSDGNCHTT